MDILTRALVALVVTSMVSCGGNSAPPPPTSSGQSPAAPSATPAIPTSTPALPRPPDLRTEAVSLIILEIENAGFRELGRCELLDGASTDVCFLVIQAAPDSVRVAVGRPNSGQGVGFITVSKQGDVWAVTEPLIKP